MGHRRPRPRGVRDRPADPAARAKDLGASAAVIGLLLASYSLAQLIGSPILGRLSDRIGRKPLLILALAGSATGHLLTGLAGSVAILFVARILDGFSGASVSVAYAAAADMAGHGIATGSSASSARPSPLASWSAPRLAGSPRWAGTACRSSSRPACAGLTRLTAWWRLPETHRHTPGSRRTGARGAVRPTLGALSRGDEISRLLAVSLLGGLGFAGFEATFSLVGDLRVGMSEATAGAVFALAGVVIAVVQGGLVHVVLDAWGERRTLRVGPRAVRGGFRPSVARRGGGVCCLAGIVVLVVGQGLLSPSISSALAAAVDPAQGAPRSGSASRPVRSPALSDRSWPRGCSASGGAGRPTCGAARVALGRSGGERPAAGPARGTNRLLPPRNRERRRIWLSYRQVT